MIWMSIAIIKGLRASARLYHGGLRKGPAPPILLSRVECPTHCQSRHKELPMKLLSKRGQSCSCWRLPFTMRSFISKWDFHGCRRDQMRLRDLSRTCLRRWNSGTSRRLHITKGNLQQKFCLQQASSCVRLAVSQAFYGKCSDARCLCGARAQVQGQPEVLNLMVPHF